MGIEWTLPEADAVDRAANIAMPVRSWMPWESRAISDDGLGLTSMGQRGD